MVKTMMGVTPVDSGIQELSLDELESVNGGILPLIIAGALVCAVAGGGFAVGYTGARLVGLPAVYPLP